MQPSVTILDIQKFYKKLIYESKMTISKNFHRNYTFKMTKSNGFSLLEMMVIIAIIGVVSVLGISNFTDTASNNEFKKGDILTETFIEEIKSKAFTNNRPYKIYIENNTNGIELKAYGPNGTAWVDPNLIRRCNCQVGTSLVSGCTNVFLNSLIGQTPIETKIIEGINVKKCSNANCDSEVTATVELCLLSNGTSPRTTYFKIKDLNTDNSKIKKSYKTGYVK